MLNIPEINRTINQLENGDTTFDNCIKLAALYIVTNYYNNGNSEQEAEVTKELSDILPQYKIYCAVKKKYQLGETNKDWLVMAMKDLCKEIKEVFNILYSSTDMAEERESLKELIADLYKKYDK